MDQAQSQPIPPQGATANQQSGAQSNAPQTFADRVQAMLKNNTLLPLIIGGAAVIALAIALVMWAASPQYRVLYSNLSDADGGQVISELESRGINYRLGPGGNSVMVPANEVHRLRLQLAEQGLPNAGNVGFSLMDDQAFGISQFAEQVNFQRALEGELANSMESLGPVARARVHLAMAKPSVFVRDREPAKASVVLTLHAGRTLGDGQVAAIVHMVSSSVPELSADHVTVVDQRGTLLSRTGSDQDQFSGNEMEYVREIERSFQQRIENILAPVVGLRNVRAQVVAHVDFSRREETSETYSPNQTPDTAAIRSIQNNLVYNGEGQLIQGIPGALTNTPPGVLASPIEAPEQDPALGEQPQQINANVQQDNIVNYEVDRNVAHVLHQRGRVERLSVAVVVNHREALNEEGELVKVPLGEEEMDRVNRLVRQAMGFTPARGDELEVVNSLFVAEPDQVTEPLQWWEAPEVIDMVITAVRYILAGIGILLLYALILRPLLKRRFRSVPAQRRRDSEREDNEFDDQDFDEESELPAAKKGMRDKIRSMVGRQQEEDGEEEPFHWPKRAKHASYREALLEAQEIAKERPRQVARIVQHWMGKE